MAARALERAQVKDWELLAYGIGTSGGTTGLPNDSSLIHYDPRGYGNSAFNHSLAEDLDPRPEIIEDGNAIISLLGNQTYEDLLGVEGKSRLREELGYFGGGRSPGQRYSYSGFGRLCPGCRQGRSFWWQPFFFRQPSGRGRFTR